MLRHGNTVGTLELSTAYTWTDAEETLSVGTSSGIFRLGNMERLTYRPRPVKLFSVPMEKVLPHHTVEKVLFQSSHFMGGLTNNQVYTQGFYGEIKAFLDAVEGKSIDVRSSLQMIRGSYELLSIIE